MKAAACPVCGVAFGRETPLHCDECHAPHHEECFEYNGRCAVYGCAGKRGTRSPGLGTGNGDVLVIDEDPRDRLPERMFFPVPAHAPARRVAGWLAMGIAICVVGTAIARGTVEVAAVLAAMTVAGAVAVRRGLRGKPAVIGQSWEIDRASGELAVLTRVPGRVRRELLAELREIRSVVLTRDELMSLGGSGEERYGSAWSITLKLPGRVVPLVVPEWTDGHLSPPTAMERTARQLARHLERTLVLDPPPEGKLPPGLGKLPSQGGR